MKKNFTIILLSLHGIMIQAQQNFSRESYQQDVRFSQYMDKLSSDNKKMKYEDIQGSPYYHLEFLPARFGNTSSSHSIRYNIYSDTIEMIIDNKIDEIPKTNIVKESPLSKFTFNKSKETLILVDSHDDRSGYFFLLADGKNQLLKKINVEFKPEVPAPNHLIPRIPARFEKPAITYFIKNQNGLIEIPKKESEFLIFFPHNTKQIKSFKKKYKLKLSNQKDLIKLVNYINSNEF